IPVFRRVSLQPYPETTLPALLHAAAQRHGPRPALIADDQPVTFAHLDDLVARCAGALEALGIGKTNTIGVLLPNSVEFVVAYFGSLLAGARVSPMNPILREREVVFQAA